MIDNIKCLMHYKKIKAFIRAYYFLFLYRDMFVEIDLPKTYAFSTLDLKKTYKYYFFAENLQYFNLQLVRFPLGGIICGTKFAVMKLDRSYEDYMTKSLKSAERALVRKAIKNGMFCKEINYDDYIDSITDINTSKKVRCGRVMSNDYTCPIKRDELVKPYNPDVFTYGCFNSDGKLVAYYMFEQFTNFYHTVKGIGHYDYLSFGIMNYLFAFSVGQLFQKGKSMFLLYGTMDGASGLSRYKKNVGMHSKYLLFRGDKSQFRMLKQFNRTYKFHGDTALNLVLDYTDKKS